MNETTTQPQGEIARASSYLYHQLVASMSVGKTLSQEEVRKLEQDFWKRRPNVAYPS